MNLQIIRFVREAGYDNTIYFGYEVPEDAPIFTVQRARENDKMLLKKVDTLVHKDDSISRNEEGHYMVTGKDLERLLCLAKVELQQEKEQRIKEAEENRAKNRKLAQASYDIFAWDKEESSNLEKK